MKPKPIDVAILRKTERTVWNEISDEGVYPYVHPYYDRQIMFHKMIGESFDPFFNVMKDIINQELRDML